jgi:integrase
LTVRPGGKASRRKPFINPKQFVLLLALIPEPCAAMVFVAVHTGLRVSELIGLKWQNVHADSITVEDRYCRGDGGATKAKASNATIPVNQPVIELLQRIACPNLYGDGLQSTPF